MSHFTVMVFGENVDEQMEKYEESPESREFLVFKSDEEEYQKNYREDTITSVVLPDGTVTHEYDEKYRQYDTKSFSSNYVFPEGSVKKEVKFCEYYSTFEEYMQKWCGYEDRDEEHGVYGHWHNPNAKYDWYSVGGRWTGYFKPKAGIQGQLGRPGAFDNEPKEGWVDSLKINEIDIEGMKEEAAKQANLEYDKVEGIIRGRPLPSWQKIVEECGEDYDKAREIYADNEVNRDFKEANIFVWGGLYEAYRGSREEYVQFCVDSTLVPFAVVRDGQWYQKGEMGWWGSVSDEKDQTEWNSQFWKLFNSMPEDTQVTLLDCHI